MSEVETYLSDAEVDGWLSILQQHQKGLQVQAGVWSRTAGALVGLVLQAISEQALAGRVLRRPTAEWFSREAIERLCISGPTPALKADALRWLRGLPGNSAYDPEHNAAWSSAAVAWFDQIQTMVFPVLLTCDLVANEGRQQAGDFVGDPKGCSDLVDAAAMADALRKFSGGEVRNWRTRTRSFFVRGLETLRVYRTPRAWWPAIRTAARTLRMLLAKQLREICAEVARALRPAAKVRVLRNFGIALTSAKRHGGGTILVPLSASGGETLGACVEAQANGYDVSLYSEAALEGRAALRVVRWQLKGVQDRLAAEQLVGRIEGAMVTSAGGGATAWPKVLAGLAAVLVVVVLLPGRPADSKAQPTAAAPAGQKDPNATLSALFGATASAASGADAQGIPEDVMAAVLAGAGMDPAAAAQLQDGTTDDPWVAQMQASARQVAQQTIYQNGVVSAPVEDPGLKQFGLGKSIAGCDPALKFKVSE